jgi:hypothetical protein
MLATLSALVLMTAAVLPSTRPAPQPCSFIVGGFLNEPMSPGAAVEQARTGIWNVYRQHATTCIDLRIFARQGAVANIIFRSQNQDGRWTATIINTSGVAPWQRQWSSAEFKDVQAIERIERTGERLRDSTAHRASEYNLLFRLKDGTTMKL